MPLYPAIMLFRLILTSCQMWKVLCMILKNMVGNLQFSILLGKIHSTSFLIAQRESEFHRRYPDFGNFFHTVVNGDYSLFREGLLHLITISNRLVIQL